MTPGDADMTPRHSTSGNGIGGNTTPESLCAVRLP
jgi:hypothetical protein